MAVDAHGISFADNVLATIARLDQTRRLAQAATNTATKPGGLPTYQLVTSGHRQRLSSGAFWGAHTGPNPTDRAKLGSKRHVIVDANGLPLAVHTGPANERDDQAAPATIKRLPKIIGSDGKPRKPKYFQGDRGYGFPALIAWIVKLLMIPLIALRGSEHGSGLGKTRYVVERSLAWMGHYRRLRSCYEKTPAHFQAFHEIAVCVQLSKRLHRCKRRQRPELNRRKIAKRRF